MMIRNQRPNPYVGPRAFETGETLFGRDKEINELINVLIAERIVLLYSPSGAGKTSLVRAGLIPLLEEEGFPTLPVVRVNLEPPEDLAGNHFNRYVYSTLISLEEGLPENQQTPIERLAETSLSDYLAQRPKPERPSEDEFWERADVLIFDQFEEVITASPFDLESKGAFFAQLGEALLDKSRWALFSMREDFIGALDPYLREIPNHLDVRFRLNLLEIDQARQAIQRPPRQVSVEFTDSSAQQLVEDLSRVHTQLPDGSMVELPGPYVEPVQLQVVCYRLWGQLASDDMLINEEDLEAVGDVDQSLAEYYDECIATVVEKSAESEQSIRYWFEHHLITEGNIRSQVLMEKDSSRALSNQAIFQLENTHLVRRDVRRGLTWFELAHDRLISPVRESNAAWFRAHQSPFQRQAALWEEQDYPDHLLLTGKDLAKVEQWVAEQKGQLLPLEKKYLDSCREADAQRTRKRLRRSRFLTAVLTFLTVLSCAFGILAVLAYSGSESARAEADEQRQIAVEQRQLAEDQRLIAEEQKKEADDQRLIAQEERSNAEFQRRVRFLEAQALNSMETEPDLALLLSLEAYQMDKSPELRGVLFDAIVKNTHLVKYVRHHRGLVMAIAFRPDGKILATGSEDGTVVLWDAFARLPLGMPVFQDSNNPVYSLAFSPDGKLLAVGTANGSVYLWDITDPLSPAVELARFSEHAAGVFSLAFNPQDGNMLASASFDGTVFIWDVETRHLSTPIDHPAVSLAFSPDGEHLALGDKEGLVTILDGITFEQTIQYAGHSNLVYDLEFSPDSQTLASGSYDESVALWDIETNQITGRLSGHTSWVFTLAFSPDGRKLASGGRDHTILVWEIDSGQIIERLHGHAWAVVSLAFNPLYSGRLLSGSWDRAFIEWDLDMAQPLVTDLPAYAWPQTTHSSWVSSVAFKPGDAILASADANRNVFFWNLEDLLPSGEPLVLDNMARALAYDREGRILAIGSCSLRDDQSDCSAGQLGLWDADSLEPIGEALSAHTDWISSLAFSPADNLLATGSWDGSVILWDISNPAAPAQLGILSEHSDIIPAVSFSPDGKILASGSYDGTINLWELSDPQSPQLLEKLAAASYGVLSLAFSPDGKILASGDGDAEVILWDVETRQQIGSDLLGHKGLVWSVAFSPDGEILATGGSEGALILWDIANRTRIGQPLSGHSNVIYSLAFSADGKRVASSGDEGELFLWNIADEDLEQIACNKAARNLTAEEQDYYLSDPQDGLTCPGVAANEKLLEANALALSGAHDEAAVAFEEAVGYGLQTDDVSINNSLCWFGSLDGFAEVVMPVCERAVELGTLHTMVLDSRGLARALTGNYPAAIEDFTRFIDTFEDNPNYADLVVKRRTWVNELRAGRNPFDAETLKSLRLE